MTVNIVDTTAALPSGSTVPGEALNSYANDSAGNSVLVATIRGGMDLNDTANPYGNLSLTVYDYAGHAPRQVNLSSLNASLFPTGIVNLGLGSNPWGSVWATGLVVVGPVEYSIFIDGADNKLKARNSSTGTITVLAVP